MAVFGRERELAVASEFLDRARDRPSALILEGDAGVGKSTIWDATVGRAAAAGIRVLHARPTESEVALPLITVADLFEGVPPSVFADLPAPQRGSIEAVLLRAQPDETSLARRTLTAAVRSSLELLAADMQVLVAIDDVHWLDPASAAVLTSAMRRATTGHVKWLLTRRTATPTVLLPDHHLAAGAVDRLHVAPLEPAALREIVCDRFDDAPPRPVLLSIVAASGGNPLHALEIARELRRHKWFTPTTQLPVPADLRALVAQRLSRLPARTGRELLAAAALAAPDTAILDEDALGPAEEADLVHIDAHGGIAFTHPLIASAVYRSASTARRRVVHAELASLVDDSEQCARHLALAATGPDETIARLLVEGATLARRRGAWEAAAELLERARDLTPVDRPQDAFDRVVSAAEHHAHAGDRGRARAVLEDALDTPVEGERRAQALRVLAEISTHDENFAEARTLFTAALARTDDPRLAAVNEMGISYAYANEWDHVSALSHASRALELAELAGDPALTARALAHTVMYEYLCGRGVDAGALERALLLEDPEAVVALESRPTVIAALLHLFVGDHDTARAQLCEIAAGAADRGDESDLAFIQLWRSWLEVRSGDYAAADALADDGLTVAGLTGSQSTHAWLVTQRALISAHRGDVEATRRDCASTTALLPRFGSTLSGIWIAASLALLELSLGNASAAWAACAPLVRHVEEQGLREPVVAFFLPDAIEALASLGHLDRAEALLGQLEARADALDRSWALATAGRCRALVQAARSDLDGALAAVARARVAHDRLDMPFERARTELVAGVIERRCRQRARAGAAFREALETFERLGARLWAADARQQLARLGTRRSAGQELTATERRIAELAGRGLTNRQVAAALFISPKTVEANLGRVYRKLGIASRAELGARMGPQPQT